MTGFGTREASWTAVVLHRFGAGRTVNQCNIGWIVWPTTPYAAQSGRGLPQSKTLRAWRAVREVATASWTAVVLHRFGADRTVNSKKSGFTCHSEKRILRHSRNRKRPGRMLRPTNFRNAAPTL